MQRLAAQLGCGPNGQTLIGKPGERIQFGCSSRIRHTLAPDNSSLTFATQGELLNHWLCVMSFEIDRDWTWDGMNQTGIEIRPHETIHRRSRDRRKTRASATCSLKKTASRVATTNPDRSLHAHRLHRCGRTQETSRCSRPLTRIHSRTQSTSSYKLVPNFIASVDPRILRQ